MAKKPVICDTDVLIDYFDIRSKRHQQTKNILDSIIELDNVVISAITKMELLMGANNKEEELKIKKMLLRFNTALINNDITLEALAMFEKYRLSHGLAIPDCLIAATAKVTGFELFTYNVKDYKFINKIKMFKN